MTLNISFWMQRRVRNNFNFFSTRKLYCSLNCNKQHAFEEIVGIQIRFTLCILRYKRTYLIIVLFFFYFFHFQRRRVYWTLSAKVWMNRIYINLTKLNFIEFILHSFMCGIFVSLTSSSYYQLYVRNLYLKHIRMRKKY